MSTRMERPGPRSPDRAAGRATLAGGRTASRGAPADGVRRSRSGRGVAVALAGGCAATVSGDALACGVAPVFGPATAARTFSPAGDGIAGATVVTRCWSGRETAGCSACTRVSVATGMAAAGRTVARRSTGVAATGAGSEVSSTGSTVTVSSRRGLRRRDLAGDGSNRSGRRRLRDRRRRRCRQPRGQQAERIDVSVRVGGDANAEVDVWPQGDGVAALADHADLRSLRDRAAAHDARHPELEHRHGVAVAGGDRDRAAATGHEADEGDGAAGRCEHGAAKLGRDVDASVLAGRVRVGTDGERPQHRPLGRPRPGERAGRGDQGT